MENFHREMLYLLWVLIGYVVYIFFETSFFSLKYETCSFRCVKT